MCATCKDDVPLRFISLYLKYFKSNNIATAISIKKPILNALHLFPIKSACLCLVLTDMGFFFLFTLCFKLGASLSLVGYLSDFIVILPLVLCVCSIHHVAVLQFDML